MLVCISYITLLKNIKYCFPEKVIKCNNFGSAVLDWFSPKIKSICENLKFYYEYWKLYPSEANKACYLKFRHKIDSAKNTVDSYIMKSNNIA